LTLQAGIPTIYSATLLYESHRSGNVSIKNEIISTTKPPACGCWGFVFGQQENAVSSMGILAASRGAMKNMKGTDRRET
jgi:hypothetical protein